MTANTSFFVSSLYMLIMGLGVGSTMQVTILVVQNAVDHSDLGVATSAAQFFRQMGGSFGVAVFGSIMNYRLAADLPSRVPPEALEEVGGQLSAFLSSPEVIRSLPQAVSSGVIESVELAIHAVFIWAVPPMILGFILAWFLQEIPLRETIDTSSVVEGAGEVLDSLSKKAESPEDQEV